MLKLGLHSHSYHLHMEDLDSPKDLNWFIARTVDLGLDACHLDSRHLSGWDEDVVYEAGRLCRENGMFLSLGTGGYDYERLSSRLQMAADVGAGLLVTFIGGDRNKVREEQREEEIHRAIESYKRLSDIAERTNVVMAIENHGDLTSVEMARFLDCINSPFIRACVNPGNALLLWEDPVECLNTLKSYAAVVHLKDWVQLRQDGVAMRYGCSLGKGHARVAEIIPLLNERSEIPVMLEIPTIRPDHLACDPKEEDANVVASINFVRHQM